MGSNRTISRPIPSRQTHLLDSLERRLLERAQEFFISLCLFVSVLTSTVMEKLP